MTNPSDVAMRALALHDAWRREVERPTVDDDAEQAAYDALVEYVEAHGLNGSKLDPRGPLP